MADKKQDLALLTFTPEFKREFKRLAKKHVSPSRSKAPTFIHVFQSLTDVKHIFFDY